MVKSILGSILLAFFSAPLFADVISLTDGGFATIGQTTVTCNAEPAGSRHEILQIGDYRTVFGPCAAITVIPSSEGLTLTMTELGADSWSVNFSCFEGRCSRRSGGIMPDLIIDSPRRFHEYDLSCYWEKL